MATRVVIHEENLARVDASSVLRDLQSAGVLDMEAGVPVRTGDLRSTIRAGDVDRDHAEILAGGIPGASGQMVDYPVYVELGTRQMKAQPFMKPALYRRRSA